MNRRLLLALVYAVGGLALLMLSTAASWNGFAVVSVLIALGSAERAVSSALVVDMAPVGAINRSLSIFESIKWLGGVLGFAVTGYAVDILGLKTAIVTSVSLPVIAIVLLGVGHYLQSRGGWPTSKWRIARSARTIEDEAVHAAEASSAAR
jgi:MFS family permease